MQEAEFLIAEGVAERLLDYSKLVSCPECTGKVTSLCARCGGRGRNPKNPAIPCRFCALEIYYRNPCARCGGTGDVPVQSWNLVRTVRAQKTPRVMTIERANIERFLLGDEEEGQRIEAWDEITQEIRFEMLRTYWPKIDDPFLGMPVIPHIGGDQRSSLGKSLDSLPEIADTEVCGSTV